MSRGKVSVLVVRGDAGGRSNATVTGGADVWSLSVVDQMEERRD